MLNECHVISHYIYRSVLSVVSCNRSRSWNVLPMDTGVRLYSYLQLYNPSCVTLLIHILVLQPFGSLQLWLSDFAKSYMFWLTSYLNAHFTMTATNCLTCQSSAVCLTWQSSAVSHDSDEDVLWIRSGICWYINMKITHITNMKNHCW
jgi:hypothetical protein